MIVLTVATPYRAIFYAVSRMRMLASLSVFYWENIWGGYNSRLLKIVGLFCKRFL